jgi:hypothetical protein
MTGMGKTTAAVGVAQIIKQLRKRPSNERRVVICCCTVRQVLIQIGQLCFHNGIEIAYASYDKKRGLIIENQYRIKGNDAAREVILCGPEACIEALKEYPDAILFDDEWTIGLDAKNNVEKNSIVKYNMEILTHHLPRQTILSTATPSFPQWITQRHEEKYGPTTFVEISSTTVRIPCEIITNDGDIFVPHSWCKTSQELAHCIRKVSKNPFLCRAYTPNVVYQMFQIMKQNGIDEVIPYEKFFMDAVNLTADNMRDVAFKLLRELFEYEDDVVVDVCSAKILPRKLYITQKTQAKPAKSGLIQWEDDSVAKDIEYRIEYPQIFTSLAHLCLGPTLIAVGDNPSEFVVTNGKDLIDLFTEKYGTIKKVQRKYQTELEMWQKEMDRLDDDADKKATKFESESERLQHADSIRSSKPFIKFSPQINTRSHAARFAKGSRFLDASSVFRSEIDVTDIFMAEMNVPDELVIMLAYGVGIYNVDCPNYSAFVNKLMNSGDLAFIVADSSIAYGVNIKLNRVITTKSFFDAFSEKTMYQLWARTGRVGWSYMGQASLESSCIDEFIESIKSTTPDDDIQGRNMQLLYQSQLQSASTEDDELIASILKDYHEKEAAEKLRAEEEAERIAAEKRRVEEEVARVAAEAEKKRLEEEEELRRLQELKERRSKPRSQNTTHFTNTTNTVNLSNVMSNPPSAAVASTGFERSSTGRVERRVFNGQNGHNGQRRQQPSLLDRLAKMKE